jgi:hypothetical protein
VLALFWNAFGFGEEMREAFSQAWDRARPDLPIRPFTQPLIEGYLQGCERAANGIAEAGGFGEPEQWRFEWDRPYTRDEWLDVIPTLGGMNRLSAETLARLLDGAGQAVDRVGGSFTVHYTTVAVAAPRS